MASFSLKANILGKRNPVDGLETKPILKKHKETTEGLADCLQHNDDQANSIPVKETVEGLDETPDFIEKASVIKNTLFIDGLSRRSKISDIIDFFKDVGEVVHVRLAITKVCRHSGYGFVEFASANETRMALEKKNGEYLHNRKIFLDVAKIATRPPLKFCIDHKVWYEDCLRRKSCLIKEDETLSDFAEEVLFVANLSPQTNISDIKDFFDNVGVVVSVRLIVNHENKHVGYAFVEFLSSNEAKKALEKKNGEYFHGHKILLMKGHGETPDFVEAVATSKAKTLFVAHLTRQTLISDIINFFKDVGEVVHVRLIVNKKGKHLGCGLVEFASANEAEKALEMKNGEYLCDGKIFLVVAKLAPFSPPEYCIDHIVWYEDYLRQESLLIEEDEAVEGLEGTPDLLRKQEKRRFLLLISLLKLKYQISSISSKMLEKLFVFGLLQTTGVSMLVVALLSLLLLKKQRRRWNKRMVKICAIATISSVRFFLARLRWLHTLSDPSIILQRSFGTKTTFGENRI